MELNMDANAVVDWDGLGRDFGWMYSRTQTKRLMDDGKFPRCFKLDSKPKSKNLWHREEVRQRLKPPS